MVKTQNQKLQQKNNLLKKASGKNIKNEEIKNNKK